MGWIRRFDMSVASERPVGLEQAADAVRRGELVVLPTDTVYGLGTDAPVTQPLPRVLPPTRKSPSVASAPAAAAGR